MPVQFAVEKGNLGVFRVSGQLSVAELEQAQGECEAVIKKEGEIKILVVLENFAGWEKAKGLGRRLVPPAERPLYHRKWRSSGMPNGGIWSTPLPARNIRKVPIEYFDVNQEEAARQWLDIV